MMKAKIIGLRTNLTDSVRELELSVVVKLCGETEQLEVVFKRFMPAPVDCA